jgi:hypothetical protein
MSEIGSLIVLIIIYCPIIIVIKKIKRKILLIILSALLFPILYIIIWYNFPYYHLVSFEGKVVDAVTKKPIHDAQIKVEYIVTLPTVAGSISHTVDNQKCSTDPNGGYKTPEVTRWFGDKNGSPGGEIKIEKEGYITYPSILFNSVSFESATHHSNKYPIIELMPITLDFIVKALYNENNNIVDEAESMLLVNFTPAQKIIPLLKALEKGNPYTRKTSAHILGKVYVHYTAIEYKEIVVAALINATKDEDPNVRFTSVEALDTLHDSHAIEALKSALDDEYERVKQAAAYALQHIEDSKARGW